MNIMLLAVLAIAAAQSAQSDPTQKLGDELLDRMKLGGLPLLRPAKLMPVKPLEPGIGGAGTVKRRWAKTMAAVKKVKRAKELENALADLDTDLASSTKWGVFKHRHHK